MAFFSLTDIKFNSGGDNAFTINQSDYNSDNRRYPIDLGSSDKGHYMAFFINVQERTQVQGINYDNSASPAVLNNRSGSENVITAFQNLGNKAADWINSINTSVDNSITDTAYYENDGSVSQGSSIPSNFLLGINKIGASLKDVSKQLQDSDLLKRGNLFRTIRRTKDTIALYMPDTLNFDYRQKYTDISVAKDMGTTGLALQAGASLLDERARTGTNSMNNMSPFAAEFVKNKLGVGGDTLFTALTGATGGALAVNPQLEMIYQSPSFRHFRFQFMFYPRSEQEASHVLDIIDLFRYHQAPEIVKSSFGRYLVPPSEFDISFYYNGSENPNIPKISTCVLTGIGVDYAPNGFAAYETKSSTPEKGRTGMPVAIRLDLTFMETEIVTKQFLKGEYNSNLGSTGGPGGSGGTLSSLDNGSSTISDQASGIQRFDDGSYIQTFEDGSTLTVDSDGNVYGSTDAPNTTTDGSESSDAQTNNSAPADDGEIQEA